jgi:hypothetical protein
MRPGDLIAFGGKGNFSTLIKMRTRSTVSHVGAVLLRLDAGAVPRVEVIESTSLYGKKGVQTNALGQHVANYGGEIWWLPLSEKVRERFAPAAFVERAITYLGRPYDFKQAVGAAIDWPERLVGNVFENDEDFQRFFCSELIAALYEHSHVLSDINASEETPADLVRRRLYRECYQIAGEPTKLTGFSPSA